MGKNCIYSFLILIGKCIIEIVECEIFSTNVQEIIAVSVEKIDFPAFPRGLNYIITYQPLWCPLSTEYFAKCY